MQALKLLAGTMLATALLFTGTPDGRAADPAAKTADPAAKMAQTSDDFIRALTPQLPSVTTRGIALGTGATAPAAAPATAPRINFQVEFEYNSTTLSPKAAAVLDELGKALVSRELASFRFELIGHTDAAGSAAYNLDLSRRRAAAVRDYLSGRFSIAADRLATIGRGEEQLLDPAHPNSGVNRRVEIVNIGG